MNDPGTIPLDGRDMTLVDFQRDAGPADAGSTLQHRMWLLHGCGFILLIVALAAILAASLRSEQADLWVQHTLEVRRASGVLFGIIQDAEAGVRGYIVTGDPALLHDYDTARAALPSAQDQLRALIQDSPLQLGRFRALVPLIDQRMSLLATLAAVAAAGDQQALTRSVHSRAGSTVMERLHARLADFDEAEADLLAKHESIARTARRELLLGGVGALTIALLLGALTAMLSYREAGMLRRANTRLAGTVSARTDALNDSERRFRQVFHDSPIGLSILTADHRRFVAANPALCRMLGYGEAELLGRAAHEFAHPDDAAVIVPVSSGADVPARPIEKRFIARSGAVLFARCSVVSLALPNEREPLILGTTEDVSRERAIEAALRDSEARMRLAVEAAGLGVWEHDVRRRAVRMDARAAAIAGSALPADSWLDADGTELTAWQTRVHPDDVAARAAAEQALLGGRSDMASSEYRLRAGDGGWTWISAFGTIVERDPRTGRALRVLTVLQDITHRKEIEIELRHAHRMEAVGQLTGGVAHDFNNLLGAILGHTEFLLDLLTERSEERELAAEILDCALNGTALTQRLLAFARRQPLQPAVIDLNEYLPVQVSLLQRTLGETISIDVVLEPGLWLTHADPSQIVDVLLNLAINARDAMPHGGTLTIRTANVTLDAAFCARHREASPGEYVALSVTDTGTGMPPEVLARALEPFFTTKPPGKGSGLGLSTIYGFSRQSGGYLDIDSAPGAGTTVRLYLPRTRAAASAAVTPPARTPPLPRGDEAILVVDDNVAMRHTAARNLAALGYHVRLAADGPSALAIMQAGERFDLLFTDLVMPNGLSGYQLAEAARALQPGLRVLFTTGFATEDDGDTGVMDAGALRKPYRRRELAERVRTTLEGG